MEALLGKMPSLGLDNRGFASVLPTSLLFSAGHVDTKQKRVMLTVHQPEANTCFHYSSSDSLPQSLGWPLSSTFHQILAFSARWGNGQLWSQLLDLRLTSFQLLWLYRKSGQACTIQGAWLQISKFLEISIWCVQSDTFCSKYSSDYLVTVRLSRTFYSSFKIFNPKSKTSRPQYTCLLNYSHSPGTAVTSLF